MTEDIFNFIYTGTFFVAITILNFFIWLRFPQYKAWAEKKYTQMAQRNVPFANFYLNQLKKPWTKWIMRLLGLVMWFITGMVTLLFAISLPDSKAG